MKNLKVYFCLIFCLTISIVALGKSNRKPVDYVNLFIGTAKDHGQTDPAACIPYGVVRVSPDCVPASHVGYDFEETRISGFSINRLSGVGCSGAGGNLSVKPASKDKILNLRKDTENATPGYYGAKLNNDILVELTANNSVAVEKFSFENNHEDRYFFIDFSKSFAKFEDCHFDILSANEIAGYISAKNTCNKGRYKFHFYLKSEHPFEVKYKTEKDVELKLSSNIPSNEIRIAVSPISIEDAKKNYNDVVKKSFTQIRKEASELWNQKLSVIEVEGKESDKIMFYTSLYRCFLTPSNVTSTVGEYINGKGELKKIDKYNYYSSWSLWDTYRTKFPLLTIIDAGQMEHFCWSLAELYKSDKKAWATDYEAVPTTRTEHASIVLLDAYRKGIRSFNLNSIYLKLQQELKNIKLNSPDSYLETAYDYWALAQIAKEIGKTNDYEMYINVSRQMWQGVWEQKFKNINPETFDIMHGDGLYEGTLWQYRWAVPFDIESLSKMVGGKDILKDQLEFFFQNNLYNQGNQPDIHAAYIFNQLGYPELTQYWVNQILTQPMKHQYGTHDKFDTPYFDKAFKPIPRSYIPEMDDDDGTMAAWYVLSAIGMYPLTPGMPIYQLSTPIFKTVKINLPEGKTLIIDNQSNNNKVIKSICLNGKEVEKFQLSHKEILSGGVLVYKY